MEAEARNGSAIILDIENLVFGAMRDKVELSTRNLTRAIVEHIRTLAEKTSYPLYKFAAISLMPKDGSKKIRSHRETIVTIVKTLVDHRFHVVVVPTGTDAADQALYDMCAGLKENPVVHTVFLGTGDGQGPLSQLVSDFTSAGKSVHVVVYDKSPQSLKDTARESSQVTFSSIAPHVRLLAEVAPETPKETGPASLTVQSSEESKPPADPIAEMKKRYRNAIRSISEATFDADLQPQAQLVVDAIASIKSVLSNGQEKKRKSVSDGFIIQTVYEDFRRADPETSLEEVRALVHAIESFTDVFDNYRTYQINLNSEFAQQAKYAARHVFLKSS